MQFSELLKVVNKIIYWETALNILSYFLKLFLMFKNECCFFTGKHVT